MDQHFYVAIRCCDWNENRSKLEDGICMHFNTLHKEFEQFGLQYTKADPDNPTEKKVKEPHLGIF